MIRPACIFVAVSQTVSNAADLVRPWHGARLVAERGTARAVLRVLPAPATMITTASPCVVEQNTKQRLWSDLYPSWQRPAKTSDKAFDVLGIRSTSQMKNTHRGARTHDHKHEGPLPTELGGLLLHGFWFLVTAEIKSIRMLMPAADSPDEWAARRSLEALPHDHCADQSATYLNKLTVGLEPATTRLRALPSTD